MNAYVSPVFATKSGFARLRIEGIAPWTGAVSVAPSRRDADCPLLVVVDRVAGAEHIDVALETSVDAVSWTRAHDLVRVDRG